jgi:hypothetical protein
MIGEHDEICEENCAAGEQTCQRRSKVDERKHCMRRVLNRHDRCKRRKNKVPCKTLWNNGTKICQQKINRGTCMKKLRSQLVTCKDDEEKEFAERQ